jgi:hypothetical protein
MRYFIGVADIEWSDSRWFHKGGRGPAPLRRKGFIGLFDRNLGKFIWFKIVRKEQDRYGYIAERKSPPTAYWRKAILQEP